MSNVEKSFEKDLNESGAESQAEQAVNSPAETAAEQKEIIIGIDSGCAYSKIAVLKDGKIVCDKVPAQVARGFAPIGTRDPGITYIADGQEWHFNSNKSDSTQFESYPYSSHNLAMYYLTAQKLGLSGKLNVSTGIPVGSYYAPGGVNQANINRKKEQLNKPVEVRGVESLAFSIQCGNVCPEAVAAVVDFACNDDGTQRHDLSGAVGVVEIGGRTTDISIVNEELMADGSSIASLDIGCLDLYRALEIAIIEKKGLNPGAKIPLKMLEQACETGSIALYHGSPAIDVGDIVAHEKRKLISRIQEEAERRFGNQHLIAILYAGGGAAMFEDQLKEFSDRGVVVLEDPQFANVRGYLKIALYL